MDYIIRIGSDESDYGGMDFHKSGLTVEQIFNDLKKNKFESVTYNKGDGNEFTVWLDYKAEEIDKDLVQHMLNNWIDCYGYIRTDYRLIKNG